MAKGKGWHGDSAGHARAAKKRGRKKAYQAAVLRARKALSRRPKKVTSMNQEEFQAYMRKKRGVAR